MNGGPKLAAFRVERRSIAVAVFIGTRLDYADSRELAAAHNKAEASAVSFINWVVSAFHISSAAIETYENGEEAFRAQLSGAVQDSLVASGVFIWQVSKAELLEAFCHPSARSRKDVRQVITNIWPILLSKRVSGAKLDAVAIGLYVQTERLFSLTPNSVQ